MKILKVDIRALTVPVDRQLERQQVYQTLKKGFEKAVEIANNVELPVYIRIQALRVVGYLAQCLAGIIKDFTAEEVEAQIASLEEHVRKIKGEKGW